MTQTVYDALVQYYRAFGVPPSQRELCELAGLRSTNSTCYYLRKLVTMGLLVQVRSYYVPVEALEYLKLFTPKKESLCKG